MANNKIVIGSDKGKDKKDTEKLIRDNAVIVPEEVPDIQQKRVQEPLDKNVWGNDHSILNKLDEKQLAERRLYVRVVFLKRVECDTIFKSIGTEPVLLSKPIAFMIVDISMSGIGIICENEIKAGTILAFEITLDNIAYKIKYEVVYCFKNEDKYRAGLKIAEKDKHFIRHLKIYVARISLNSEYEDNNKA